MDGTQIITEYNHKMLTGHLDKGQSYNKAVRCNKAQNITENL